MKVSSWLKGKAIMAIPRPIRKALAVGVIVCDAVYNHRMTPVCGDAECTIPAGAAINIHISVHTARYVMREWGVS